MPLHQQLQQTPAGSPTRHHNHHTRQIQLVTAGKSPRQKIHCLQQYRTIRSRKKTFKCHTAGHLQKKIPLQ
jgi:hypothetical protein